jgi:DNA-binding CsgD family transcriptional regulator
VPRAALGALVPRWRTLALVGHEDPVALRQRLLADIRQHVAYQWHVWLLTDPRTCVGAAPLADIPPSLLARLPELIRLKYLTTVNRWTTVEGRPAFLHEATGGELSRSLIWREALRHESIVDVATIVFRDRFGCWGFLDLWRDTEPFDQHDADFLADRAHAITTSIRQSLATTFVSAPPAITAGPVVLLLSSTLEVLGQTSPTTDYLRALVPPGEGQAPIPAGAYNVAAQLLAVEAGVDGHAPVARVHLAAGQWLALRAARLRHPGSEDRIAVTIEDASPTERIDLFARCFGLRPRETELLGLLAGGHDTRELARLLSVSENTVQDHLKSIFAKTGSRTRRSLLSRALATSP